MWKFIVLAVASIFVLQACNKQTRPEDSCHFVMNSELHRVSWNADIPVTMYIDASTVPGEYIKPIRDAMEVWNTQLNRQVFREPIYTALPDHRESDGNSVIYFIKDNWFGTTDEQARTSMFYTGDQIYEADVRVNLEKFHYAIGTGVDATKSEVDFRSLLIHELGHVLGLAHNDSEPSVMHKSLEYGEKRQDLYEIDKNSAHCEY